jgi:hypothetical protein
MTKPAPSVSCIAATLCLGLWLACSSGHAAQQEPDSSPGKVETLRKQGYSVSAITPVFSQLVAIPLPAGFEAVFENTRGNHYIQEFVLHGETVQKWTQMLTLTGDKDLALNPNVSPQAMIAAMQQGYSKTCPDSFASLMLGTLKVGETDAVAAVMSCGTASKTGEPYSEAAVIMAIKGMSDYYTVQWAVRDAASTQPLTIKDTEWLRRLQLLLPIQLCAKVPGEAAPYPSCIDKK